MFETPMQKESNAMLAERIKWTAYAMELTIQDAMSGKYDPDGGLECEFAETAIGYLENHKNAAWLDRREGWLSSTEYHNIVTECDLKIKALEAAR